jgi:hypothetical protein
MPWVPMRRIDDDPSFEWNPALPEDQRSDECWHNGRYQCLVKLMPSEQFPEGDRRDMLHLSIHAQDRGPMRNWRHLQQIKNEVAGELRTAVEVFPPEDRLTDTANEYHLWVFPEGFELPFGLGDDALVSDDEIAHEFNREPHQGQQEPWEPGLTTGRTEHSEKSRKNLRQMKDGPGLRPPRIDQL